MAINKKLIHFNKKSTFNSQKLSANSENTQYQVGGTGTVQTGAPDINYQSIVYIKDSKEIWTHGQFYGTSGGSDKEYYPIRSITNVIETFGSEENYIAFRENPSKYAGLGCINPYTSEAEIFYEFVNKYSEYVNQTGASGTVTVLTFYRISQANNTGGSPGIEFLIIYDELHQPNSSNAVFKRERVIVPDLLYSFDRQDDNTIVTKKLAEDYVESKLDWSNIKNKPVIPSTNIDDLYIKVNVSSLIFPVTDRDTINNAFGGKLSEFLSDTSKYGGVMLTTSYTTSGHVYLPLVSDFTGSNGIRKVFCVADTPTGITSVSLIINGSSIKFNYEIITYANSKDVATTTASGTVKLGSDHLLNSGSMSDDQGNTMSRYYAVRVNSKGQMGVNVPWTDTEYTLPTASASTLGGVKVGSGLAISNGVLSTTGGGEADSVAWGNVTGKPSWIGSSKPSYSWSEITSKPTLVKQVEPGTPSTDWQSAYVPLDVTYSDTSISHKIISLPMASPASGTSRGNAGLITGADKKKLDDFTDTKNTAGATNSTDRLYLIGATSQGANPQTYSKNTVYIEDDGILMSSQGFEGGAITSTAAIYAANGFFDTSDARVKTNVKELDASKADKVKLVEFDRTDKKHHGYGVIAQELEEVYPEMVNTDKDGFKSVNYDELAMVKIKYLEDKVARLEALVDKLLTK